MSNEQIISQIAILNSYLGAIKSLLIEKNVITLAEINNLTKTSLILGKETLNKVSDESVNKDLIKEIIQKEIDSL